MMDTYEAEKKLYNTITESVILGMYSLIKPIENCSTADEIMNYQKEAYDYYKGKSSYYEEGPLIGSHNSVLFSSKVNYTVAKIMRDVENILDVIKSCTVTHVQNISIDDKNT